MNVIAWLEFKLDYYDVAIQHISNYTLGNSPPLVMIWNKKEKMMKKKENALLFNSHQIMLIFFFFFFTKLKLHLKGKIWRNEGHLKIWRESFLPLENRNFIDATYNKLTGIRVLNAKGKIFKKINVSFIVHFRLGKKKKKKYWYFLNTLHFSKNWIFFFFANKVIFWE